MRPSKGAAEAEEDLAGPIEVGGSGRMGRRSVLHHGRIVACMRAAYTISWRLYRVPLPCLASGRVVAAMARPMVAASSANPREKAQYVLRTAVPPSPYTAARQ